LKHGILLKIKYTAQSEAFKPRQYYELLISAIEKEKAGMENKERKENEEGEVVSSLQDQSGTCKPMANLPIFFEIPTYKQDD
jgi:hypothetical protein